MVPSSNNNGWTTSRQRVVSTFIATAFPASTMAPRRLDDAVDYVQSLASDGITTVIATPHQLGRYDRLNSAQKIRQAVTELASELVDREIPLEIYPGGDVRVDERLPRLLDAGEVGTAADAGRHMHAGIAPRAVRRPASDDRNLCGTRPAADHDPPGAPSLFARIDRAPRKWVAAGAVLQITAGSLTGDFRLAFHDFAWQLVLAGLVGLVATDAHDAKRRPPRLSAALRMLEQRIGRDATSPLAIDNPLRVIEGQLIEPAEACTDMTMARAILDPNTLPIMGRRWDMVTFGLLAALLVFMPAAFGAVEAWSELIVLAAAAILVLCTRAAHDFRPGFPPRAHLVVSAAGAVYRADGLPIGAAAQLGLPAGWHQTQWPRKSKLLGEADMPIHAPISFYPHATVEYLRAGARRHGRVCHGGQRVSPTAADQGAAAGDLRHRLRRGRCSRSPRSPPAPPESIGSVSDRRPRMRSGSFVNYSHFCQFMNLSLGAGLAYLMIQLHELRRNSTHGFLPSRAGRTHQLGKARLGVLRHHALRDHGVHFDEPQRCDFAARGVDRHRDCHCTAAARSAGAAGSWACCRSACLFFLLLFGFDAVLRALATLRDTSALGNRWQMTLARFALGVISASGAPAWERTKSYSRCSTNRTPYLAAQADNDYAQLLEETGLVGAVLVACLSPESPRWSSN